MISSAAVVAHEGRELPSAMLEVANDNLLLSYQQRALSEVSHAVLIAIEKSRRIGLTWALAADAVTLAAASKEAGGDNVFYVSYALEMTREFIDACAMWAKAFMGISAEVGEFLFEDEDLSKPGETKNIKAFRIDFASGFSIVALSSRPRSIRGKQGLVIIDEAAFVDNLEELLKAALALIIWGARIVVVSTHNGVDNPFNQLLDDIRAGRRKGATLKITFNDAIADGLYERVRLTGKNHGMEKEAWIAAVRDFYGENAEEELDCIPKTGSGSWLDMGDVAACEHEDAGKPELYNKGLVVIGRDIARRRDADVMWAFEIVGNDLWLRERSEGRKRSFREQKTEFDRMFRDYRVLRANLDQTGMGEVIVEQEIEEKGDRVQGVLFTPPNKLDMAIALKKRHQDRTIHYPPRPEIRADFRAIKKTKGAGDTVRLVNDDTVHADLFWAAALACLAAEWGAPECHGYRGAPAGHGKFDDGPNDRSWDGGPGRMRMRPDEPAPRRGFGKGAW